MWIVFNGLLIAAALMLHVAPLGQCEEATNSYAAMTLSCLSELSVLNNLDYLRKLQDFSNWTEEAIPCFTRCIVHGRGFYDVEANKWHKQRIVDEAGADVYNYCRYELDRNSDDACEFTHRGFRCLQQAELSVNETYTVLLQCATELGATMDQLRLYAEFGDKEHIPCLFRCFAERMAFYTATYEWNFENWLLAFGPIRHADADSSICKASPERMASLGICDWMYEEYICVERLNYNTDGSQASPMQLSSTTAEPSTTTPLSTDNTASTTFTSDNVVAEN